MREIRRVLPGLAVVFVIAAACGGDDTGNGGGSSDSTVPPSQCTTPCTPGSQPCMVPSVGNCNGTFYCWDDMKWHCAPPDASAPGEGGYDAAALEGDDGGEGGEGEGGATPMDDGGSG